MDKIVFSSRNYCHVFKKKEKAIELPFCAKECGKKKKRIGQTKL